MPPTQPSFGSRKLASVASVMPTILPRKVRTIPSSEATSIGALPQPHAIQESIKMAEAALIALNGPAYDPGIDGHVDARVWKVAFGEDRLPVAAIDVETYVRLLTHHPAADELSPGSVRPGTLRERDVAVSD